MMTLKTESNVSAQGHNLEVVDIVVNLRQAHGGGAALLEMLIAAEEGMHCRYNIWIDQQKIDQALLAKILELLQTKNGQVLCGTESLGFPQLLVDEEFSHAKTDDAKRRIHAKKGWYEENLTILSAIEQFDEFIYITPSSIPLRHDWVSDLVTAGKNGIEPVLSVHRRLLVSGSYENCGWAMCGWFNGAQLRQLPLRNAFSERMLNPWKEIGDFQSQLKGPGFCLAGEWISGFDVPMDYLLFALFYINVKGLSDPLHWAESSKSAEISLVSLDVPDVPKNLLVQEDDKKPVLSLWRAKHDQQASLRELYKDASRRVYQDRDQVLSLETISLPLGAPRWNTLGGNKIRFDIQDLSGLYKGERCFIIGNGPSLNNTNLSLLKNEYTIGLNRIYLNYPKMGFQPSFLCVTNPNIVEQFHTEIDVLNSIKFLTSRTKKLIRNHWNTFFMDSKGVHDFYEDLSSSVWCEGCTVTYCAMQVAYYLGFDEVILVGVDHGFPDSGPANQLVTATGPDQNHFHPDYFGKGVKWQYPDLASSEVSYRVAKGVFEKNGRQVFDATIDGNLRVFPRVKFLKYLGEV